jgi:hypothetical protein
MSENEKSDESDNVWGAQAIAIEAGLESAEQVWNLFKHGRLPGVKKCGHKLIGSKKILRNLIAHISAAS